MADRRKAPTSALCALRAAQGVRSVRTRHHTAAGRLNGLSTRSTAIDQQKGDAAMASPLSTGVAFELKRI